MADWQRGKAGIKRRRGRGERRQTEIPGKSARFREYAVGELTVGYLSLIM